MKFTKITLAALLAGSVFVSNASADYNKGFKYYNKYVKKKSGIKSTPKEYQEMFRELVFES